MDCRLDLKRPNDQDLYNGESSSEEEKMSGDEALGPVESTAVEEIKPGDDAPGPVKVLSRGQRLAAKAAKLDDINLEVGEMDRVKAFFKRKEEEKKKKLGKPRPSMSVKTLKRSSSSQPGFFPASSSKLTEPAKPQFTSTNFQPVLSNQYPISDSASSSSPFYVVPAYETVQADSAGITHIPEIGLAQLALLPQPSVALSAPSDITMNELPQTETRQVNLSQHYHYDPQIWKPEHELAAGNRLDIRAHSTFQGSQSALRVHSMLQSESLALDKYDSKLELRILQEEKKVRCCCLSKFW